MLARNPGLNRPGSFHAGNRNRGEFVHLQSGDCCVVPFMPAIKEPERVASLYTEASKRRGAGSPYGHTSYPDYKDYSEQNEVFSDMAAFRAIDLNLSGNDRADRIQGEIVTENYFNVLGVVANHGRTILPQDNRGVGSNAVTVISFDLWRTQFGSDPHLVGKSIVLNQNPSLW